MPTSALTLLVLSLALVLRVGFAVRSRFLVDGMLAAVLAVATLEIVDLLTGLPLAPDRLFASAAEMSLGRQVGRMFPLVALSLAFLVVALLLSRSTGSRSRSASAALSLMVANFGFVLCVGYAYDTPLLFSTAPLPPAFPASRIGLRIDRSDAALVSSNSALEHMVHDVAKTMGRVVEQRDPYTQGHEQRVAALAVRLARNMGLSDDEVDGIEMAGLLHDVGKLRVPAEILTKPGRLSPAEFALIKEHPQAGYDILEGIAFPWRIADAVLQHHERMDGSGYPHGLAGDAILTAARVLAVADAVEAMAYDRPYRPALGLDAAAKEIATHPELFDPAVAASCAALYAAGTLVV
ncbi:MAG TPA: HD-GYP domain-containing protein [Coriobacteriia bacterium]